MSIQSLANFLPDFGRFIEMIFALSGLTFWIFFIWHSLQRKIHSEFLRQKKVLRELKFIKKHDLH